MSNSTERSRRWRKKMADESITEVRGIYAHADNHEAIKEMIRVRFPLPEVDEPERKTQEPKNFIFEVWMGKWMTRVRVPKDITEIRDQEWRAIDLAVVKLYGKKAYWSPEHHENHLYGRVRKLHRVDYGFSGKDSSWETGVMGITVTRVDAASK